LLDDNAYSGLHAKVSVMNTSGTIQPKIKHYVKTWQHQELHTLHNSEIMVMLAHPYNLGAKRTTENGLMNETW